MEVPGIRGYQLLPPLVSADIYYSPANHTNLNEAASLVNNERAPGISFACVGVSIGIHPSCAEEPWSDHLRGIFDLLIALGLCSISLTTGFL